MHKMPCVTHRDRLDSRPPLVHYQHQCKPLSFSYYIERLQTSYVFNRNNSWLSLDQFFYYFSATANFPYAFFFFQKRAVIVTLGTQMYASVLWRFGIFFGDLWPVTCDLWPVTCDLWPVTCDLWKEPAARKSLPLKKLCLSSAVSKLIMLVSANLT